jgi:PAS domain S-box-containing protein
MIMSEKPSYEELEQQIRERQKETSALLKASKSIPLCKTFGEAARNIFDICKELIGACSGYIALLSEEGEENEVLFLDAGGLPCDVNPELPMPIRGLREVAYRTQNVAYDNDFMESKWMQYMPSGHVKLDNVLFAPLNIQDRTVGIIGLANKPAGFNERDAQIAAAFGDLAAVALTYAENQDELRESEEKYRSMMEAMKDPIYICTPDYQVEYMNPAMIKRTGRDATGELCFKTLHDFDEKCAWCPHEKIQRGEYYELDIVSPKDNRSYHISNSPIVNKDGSISKMTVFRDTTEMHKMETQLQQAQKMESIGTLAGGIAHDFNNILFPMLGYTEMMLEDVPADSPFQDKLQGILTGAERAGDLVKQILTFSRQSDHEMKPLRMQLVIKEVLKLIRSTLPTTIGINKHISNDCRLVMADPTQVHQIAMNLMTNAYHAMEETGGTLKVTLKEVELTAEDLKGTAIVPGLHVCLEVSDTGSGIDQGDLDRIFDPYFTTKEEGKGTGLGLAVVHGIVKSHGGHISVHSEPGKGTEFKVYLPVIQLEGNAKEIEKFVFVPKGDERVLLVDDEQQVVFMLKQMLERLGYHVTCRTSSVEALEAFRQNPNSFDLVITDMTMPNMTGEQLTRQIIEIRLDMPVILCTGFSEKMSEERAEALGIKGFLMKPVAKIDLANTIRKVLDKSHGGDKNG